MSADDRTYRRLNETIEDEVKRFPVVDLVRILFPGHPIHSRRLISSPLREDRHPSFSMWVGAGGVSRWKDLAFKGEQGSNIDLYRRYLNDDTVSYSDCVDQLSQLMFHKTAYIEEKYSSSVRKPAAQKHILRPVEPEKQSVLNVVKDLSLDSPEVPAELRDYWRGRAISDSVIASRCRYIVFNNTSRPDLPESHAIGQYNDLGGVVLRVPETAQHPGFKGATSSFITTFLSDGSRPSPTVRFIGNGYCDVSYLGYNEQKEYLSINRIQGFAGVKPWAADILFPTLQPYYGKQFTAREIHCYASILSALNAPKSKAVFVKEGMFDDLSDMERMRISPNPLQAHDTVILNSIENRGWAVPFLVCHSQIVLLLDNDISSGAGHRAAEDLRKRISDYSVLVGLKPVVYDGSILLGEYNDLNDALCASKGFPVKDARQKAMQAEPVLKKGKTNGLR